MKRVLVGVLSVAVLVACSAGKGSVALEELKKSARWGAPMVVNICREPDISCDFLAPAKRGDDAGCYLLGENEKKSAHDGPLLQALADQGYVTLGRRKVAPTMFHPGLTEKLVVDLTPKGAAVAIKPAVSGCGVYGLGSGKASWSIALAEKSDVRVVAVEVGPDGQMMTARAQWRWKLTPTGEALATRIEWLAKAPQGSPHSDEQLVKTMDGWKLVPPRSTVG